MTASSLESMNPSHTSVIQKMETDGTFYRIRNELVNLAFRLSLNNDPEFIKAIQYYYNFPITGRYQDLRNQIEDSFKHFPYWSPGLSLIYLYSDAKFNPEGTWKIFFDHANTERLDIFLYTRNYNNYVYLEIRGQPKLIYRDTCVEEIYYQLANQTCYQKGFIIDGRLLSLNDIIPSFIGDTYDSCRNAAYRGVFRGIAESGNDVDYVYFLSLPGLKKMVNFGAHVIHRSMMRMLSKISRNLEFVLATYGKYHSDHQNSGRRYDILIRAILEKEITTVDQFKAAVKGLRIKSKPHYLLMVSLFWRDDTLFKEMLKSVSVDDSRVNFLFSDYVKAYQKFFDINEQSLTDFNKNLSLLESIVLENEDDSDIPHSEFVTFTAVSPWLADMILRGLLDRSVAPAFYTLNDRIYLLKQIAKEVDLLPYHSISRKDVDLIVLDKHKNLDVYNITLNSIYYLFRIKPLKKILEQLPELVVFRSYEVSGPVKILDYMANKYKKTFPGKWGFNLLSMLRISMAMRDYQVSHYLYRKFMAMATAKIEQTDTYFYTEDQLIWLALSNFYPKIINFSNILHEGRPVADTKRIPHWESYRDEDLKINMETALEYNDPYSFLHFYNELVKLDISNRRLLDKFGIADQVSPTAQAWKIILDIY